MGAATKDRCGTRSSALSVVAAARTACACAGDGRRSTIRSATTTATTVTSASATGARSPRFASVPGARQRQTFAWTSNRRPIAILSSAALSWNSPQPGVRPSPRSPRRTPRVRGERGLHRLRRVGVVATTQSCSRMNRCKSLQIVLSNFPGGSSGNYPC